MAVIDANAKHVVSVGEQVVPQKRCIPATDMHVRVGVVHLNAQVTVQSLEVAQCQSAPIRVGNNRQATTLPNGIDVPLRCRHASSLGSPSDRPVNSKSSDVVSRPRGRGCVLSIHFNSADHGDGVRCSGIRDGNFSRSGCVPMVGQCDEIPPGIRVVSNQVIR